MPRLHWPLVVALLLGGMLGVGRAQEQRFVVGGGGGFATLFNPEFDLGRGTNMGGFFGLRLNDNFTAEVSLDFTNVSRAFTVGPGGEVIVETDPAVVATFQLQQDRYHLDGTLYYHFGRRKPFHLYILGGGGGVRRDIVRSSAEEASERTIENEPTVSFGGGFDYYVLYNVGVRVDMRWWLPGGSFDGRTRRIFFGLGYYF
jgi:hypothetical protein